jgi:CheY-like chemotaxis protein
MNKFAPVIVVDDDPEDFELVQEIWKDLKLPYPLIFFTYGQQLLDYLKAGEEIPFIIISDVNLAGMHGFELRKKILEDKSARHKSIPFIFWSGTATENQIKEAYELSSHGFFIKAGSFIKLKEIIKDIIAYWHKSEVPFLDEAH